MLIDELVAYCDSRYRRPDRCPGCPNDCKGSCDACLRAIHFPEGEFSRPYNCENISNFYVCKYIYKYASEIDHLMTYFEPLERLDAYRILSIGCGPCTELAGVLNFLSRNRLRRRVDYLGIDPNEIWQPIHDRVLYITGRGAQAVRATFAWNDALTAVRQAPWDSYPWRPNVLMLQYLISSLVNDGQDIRAFVAGVTDSVVPLMPADSYIVLNDINHNTMARDHFDTLVASVARNYQVEVSWFAFRDSNDPNFRLYGNQQEHPRNALTTAIPTSIRAHYKPAEFCTSAQMVIQKRS